MKVQFLAFDTGSNNMQKIDFLSFSSRVRDGGIEGLIKSLSGNNRQSGLKTVTSSSNQRNKGD